MKSQSESHRNSYFCWFKVIFLTDSTMVNHHFLTPFGEYCFFPTTLSKVTYLWSHLNKDTACNLRQILEKVRDSLKWISKTGRGRKFMLNIRLLWDSRVFSSYSMLEKVETAVFSPVNQWVAPWKICEHTTMFDDISQEFEGDFLAREKEKLENFRWKNLGFQFMWIHVGMNCWCDWILESRGHLRYGWWKTSG